MEVWAAIIARNESTEIAGCLDSVRGADGVALVDTGSEDDTLDMARLWATSSGTRMEILEIPWEDDFSSARNAASSLAESCGADWVMHIDADMRLSGGGMEAVRAACGSEGGRTMNVLQKSPCGRFSNSRPMLHRPGERWSGRIHESLPRNESPPPAGVEMVYGRSKSHERDPGRNLRILRRDASENPSPRIFYYLGSELYDRGEVHEAYFWFEKCARSSNFRGERADARLFMAKILWIQCLGSLAREQCMKSIGEVPDSREALLWMAKMSFEREAAVWRRFAESAGNEGVVFVRPVA